jgi:Dyp-type peroxidase family
MTVGDADRQPAARRDELRLRSSDRIQGNILAGFNKRHQAFLFLNFGDANSKDRGQAGANARAWLATLVDRIAATDKVAAFNEQFREERRRRGGKHPPDLTAVWVNVGLTYSGLLALHPELEPDLRQYEAFWQGPTGVRTSADGKATPAAELLGDTGDSNPQHWVIGGPGQAPDAAVTIAADSEKDLVTKVAEELALAERSGLTMLRQELGRRLPGGTEHFGFKDGVSQPGVRHFTEAVPRNRRKEDANHPGSPIIAAGEFVLGYAGERRQNPSTRPLSTPPWMHDGSFQVFRRLVQDVSLWRSEKQRLKKAARNVDAKLIGRRPDGRPLAATKGGGNNDFDYAADPEGYQTPRFAHIRKVNPRDDEMFYDRTHRMLRRGIPFGTPFDPAKVGAAEEDADRGLLFNAFMASIEDQFEFVQRSWASNPHFPSQVLDRERPRADGHDPLIGVGSGPCVLRRKRKRRFRRKAKTDQDLHLDLPRFVRTTGAVYAFAPSIPALRSLAARDLMRDE